MRGDPREQKIKGLLAQLRALGVEINNHTHQFIYESKQEGQSGQHRRRRLT